LLIGERQLCAWVRALAADDHPGTRRPAGQVKSVGDLGDLPIQAFRSVLVQRAGPIPAGDLEDRGANRVG
jgi:hypothetical protein